MLDDVLIMIERHDIPDTALKAYLNKIGINTLDNTSDNLHQLAEKNEIFNEQKESDHQKLASQLVDSVSSLNGE